MKRLQVIALVLAVPLLVWAFFAVAGRWDWVAGWGYIGVLVLGSVFHGLHIWWKNPELVKQRAKFGEGTKVWDKVCLPVFGLSYIAILVVGALDGGRLGWSTMPIWLWPVGAAMHISYQVVLSWSMTVNPHFEKTARIQRDRGHRVADSGPYRIVRHPGYLATILGFVLGPPLMLGSWWAFVPAVLAAACLVVRTALEDRMLREELDGYDEYAGRVRYRLLPGVW